MISQMTKIAAELTLTLTLTLAGAACSPAERPVLTPLGAAAPAPLCAANPWESPARKVLDAHCGSCHRQDLPTARPAALAVFDLTRETWYDTIRPEQFEPLLMRIRGSADIEALERIDVERFVGCARDGLCE